MDNNKCKECAPERVEKFEPDEWVRQFYQPLIDVLSIDRDIKRCPCCQQVYQLSFIQCFACFVLMLLITITDLFILYIPVIGRLLGVCFFIATIPLALEIPRRYLPWKKVKESLLYCHWKSRLGLGLACVLGIILGLAAFYAIID